VRLGPLPGRAGADFAGAAGFVAGVFAAADDFEGAFVDAAAAATGAGASAAAAGLTSIFNSGLASGFRFAFDAGFAAGAFAGFDGGAAAAATAGGVPAAGVLTGGAEAVDSLALERCAGCLDIGGAVYRERGRDSNATAQVSILQSLTTAQRIFIPRPLR
jgi:hypothetical protein